MKRILGLAAVFSVLISCSNEVCYQTELKSDFEPVRRCGTNVERAIYKYLGLPVVQSRSESEEIRLLPYMVNGDTNCK